MKRELWFDDSQLNHKGGISSDSVQIFEYFNEAPNFLVKKVNLYEYRFPLIINLPTKVRLILVRFLRLWCALTFTSIKINIPKEVYLFQPQISAFRINCDKGKHIVRLHDIFPLTNKEWFRFYSARLFKIGFCNLTNGTILLLDSYTTQGSLKKYVLENNLQELEQYVLYCSIKSKPLNPCEKCKACRDSKTVKNYFLNVATIEPRKNHKYILENWKLVNQENLLVIIGRYGWKSIATKRKILNYEKNGTLIWYRDACDFSVFELMKNSTALISASFDEGFDLPPAEALSTGTRILLSDIPVHREIYNDMACFFNLSNVYDLSRIINNLKHTKRSEFVNYKQFNKLTSQLDLITSRIFI